MASRAPAPAGATSASTQISAPSGTVTFVFTDIEGSTRLLERLRGRYAEVLAEQRRYLDIEHAYTDALREAYDARTALRRALGDVR